MFLKLEKWCCKVEKCECTAFSFYLENWSSMGTSPPFSYIGGVGESAISLGLFVSGPRAAFHRALFNGDEGELWGASRRRYLISEEKRSWSWGRVMVWR
jgi:hypothetical protein